MSEIRASNLRNQDRCKARSKRSGLQCNQPAMRGKAVCRFHGGKSTGPKTQAGRERIREVHFIHGRYSKTSEEARLVIRANKSTEKLIQSINQSSKRVVNQFQAMGPYLKAYRNVERQEEFELVNLLLFGRLGQILKENPHLRALVKEVLDTLYEKGGMKFFETFLHQMDHNMATRLGLDASTYSLLEPQERHEEYLHRLSLKLEQIQTELDFPQE